MENSENIIPEDFTLVLSVGGSTEPLIKSIRHYKPKRVIFVASKDSNAKTLDIMREIDGVEHNETITLSNCENLLDCMREIRSELPNRLQCMRLPRDSRIIADFTGGTKVMSSALALAMMEFNSRFSYVGGDVRNKIGLGTVESGHEKIYQMENPWEAMGLREADSLINSFNAAQYAAARENAIFLKSRISDYATFYDGLANVIEAFQNWDIFNYKSANALFKQGLGRLGPYNNSRHKNFRELYENIKQAGSNLEKAARDASLLQSKKFEPLKAEEGDAYLADLVANASRCAKNGRYDDAVARLYSAIEKTGKIALAKKGIDNSHVGKDILERASEYLQAKYAEAPENDIKMPLTDSFLLLCDLYPDDPVAIAYKNYAEELSKTLLTRNNSLLAHGYIPVSEEDYKKLHAVSLGFLGLDNASLPDFPVFDRDSILF